MTGVAEVLSMLVGLALGVVSVALYDRLMRPRVPPLYLPPVAVTRPPDVAELACRELTP